jgi:hypothetical protein
LQIGFFSQKFIAPPGNIDHTFNYQKEFVARPGDEARESWDLLIPCEFYTDISQKIH